MELINLVSYIEKKEKCQGDAKTLNRIRQSTIKLGIVGSIRLNSNIHSRTQPMRLIS